ncbi:MAG: hypothetical protein ACRC33_00205 [Gemmataceae bacterium]
MAKATLTQIVSGWLGRVSAVGAPPASVVAYNVGLLETKKGYAAYLIGADRYDEADGDWACRESFTPAERYLPLPGKGFAGWQDVHAAVVAAVREFLASPAGRESFLGRAAAVTVGFDDGELERVA